MKNEKEKFSKTIIASEDYLKSEKLLSEEGFILGDLGNNEIISETSNMNVLVLAPTASGKGVACVIPNLLSWKDSVIIHDIKCENFNLTSGYRKNILKQDVFLWDPTGQKTNCFNPLDILNEKNINPVVLSQKIAKILLPNNDYYAIEARDLLIFIMLYLKNTKNNTFFEVLNILKNNNEIINNNYSYSSKSSEDKDRIKSKAINSIELWEDSIICNTTRKSDFSLKDFNKKSISLYVGIDISNIDRLRPLLQIFYLECFESLISNIDTKLQSDIKKSTLLIFDEFCSIGKMDFIESYIPYTRGFKVKLLLISQNLEDLQLTYGKKSTNQIFSNCPYKIIYATNNYETAEFIGKITLLQSEELFNMKKLEEIIILPDLKVVKCNKFMYYSNQKFTDKMLDKAEI